MKTLKLLAMAFVIGIWALPAMAGPLTPITSPDAAYLASTTYLDISYITPSGVVGSITDGVLTVGFSTSMQRRAVGSGWATWSVAPDSQRAPGEALPILWTQGATAVSMTLSQGVLVFGFEAEPNPSGFYSMTASFFDASHGLLGSITRQVNGNAGARLFAASVDPIAYVDFSCGGCDFAVGAFRYAPVPEPATFALLGAGLAGLALIRRRRSA